jgi:hypothetical protein
MVTYVNKQLRENRIKDDNSIDIIGWSVLPDEVRNNLVAIYVDENWVITDIDEDTKNFKGPEQEEIPTIIVSGTWQFSRFDDDLLPGAGTWVANTAQTEVRIATQQTDDLGEIDFSVVQPGNVLEFRSDNDGNYRYNVVSNDGTTGGIAYFTVTLDHSFGDFTQLEYTYLDVMNTLPYIKRRKKWLS